MEKNELSLITIIYGGELIGRCILDGHLNTCKGLIRPTKHCIIIILNGFSCLFFVANLFFIKRKKLYKRHKHSYCQSLPAAILQSIFYVNIRFNQNYL